MCAVILYNITLFYTITHSGRTFDWNTKTVEIKTIYYIFLSNHLTSLQFSNLKLKGYRQLAMK